MPENQPPRQTSALTLVREKLDTHRSDIVRALPREMSADHFTRVALNTLLQNPNILKCDQNSILLSLMQAASLGLVPDGFLGYCHLVPFKTRCTLMIGFKGYVELARRSGVAKIDANPVYSGEKFEIEFGSEERLIHVPNLDIQRDGSSLDGIDLFYGIAWFQDGTRIFDWMPTEEVQRIRGMARAGNVWGSHPVEMGRKTMIRRLAKRLPLSGVFGSAISLENAVDERGTMPPLVGEFADLAALHEAEQGGSRTDQVREHVLGNGGAADTAAEDVEDDLPFDDAPYDEEPHDGPPQQGALA